MTCKLCKHPRISEVEGLVRAGKLDIRAASRELDASYQETWKHFKECATAPEDEKEFEEYLDIMRNLVVRLNERVKDLEDTPTSLVSVKMLTSLVKEIRGLIRDLGALEGRLRSSPLVQLTNITVKYEKLTSIMFSSLCDTCRLKLAKQLEVMEPIKLEDYR